MNEIIDKVFIGNAMDATYWGTSETGIDVVLDLRWMSIYWKDARPTGLEKDEVELAVKVLDTIYDAGKCVMVHCDGGIDRAPFVVALWMSRKLCIDVSTAYEIIKEKRPQIFEHNEWTGRI